MEFSSSERRLLNSRFPQIDKLVVRVQNWVNSSGDWETWVPIGEELEEVISILPDLERELLYRKTADVLGISNLKGLE